MMIRIGIIGSRSIREKYKIYALLNKIFRRYPDAELVSGGAEGPDSFAYDYVSIMAMILWYVVLVGRYMARRLDS